jgi:hypothetical protein
MLNTKKYLYILPDSAYIAEVLPAKKPHTFAIQAFRQINGEFLDDNEFLASNVEKLIKKIEPDEYHLILPDFLFTNTIVDIHQTEESEVKKYLRDVLLPSIDLSKGTHEIDTFILTQHQGKSKVQLSALEKSLMAPIQKAAAEQRVSITHVSPLSWTIKSVVSLEPSISTIQIGGMLYLAQHYIGVDQSVSFPIEEIDNIVETVKTLKGAEPNTQTMYLLTNALVESALKEKLSGTLPIQQLANAAEEQEGIPSYLKQIIEAGAKTLDIADYPVPRFELGKYTGEITPVAAQTEILTSDEPKQKGHKESEETAQELIQDHTLPSPTMIPASEPSPEIPPSSELELPLPTAPTVLPAPSEPLLTEKSVGGSNKSPLKKDDNDGDNDDDGVFSIAEPVAPVMSTPAIADLKTAPAAPVEEVVQAPKNIDINDVDEKTTLQKPATQSEPVVAPQAKTFTASAPSNLQTLFKPQVIEPLATVTAAASSLAASTPASVVSTTSITSTATPSMAKTSTPLLSPNVVPSNYAPVSTMTNTTPTPQPNFSSMPSMQTPSSLPSMSSQNTPRTVIKNKSGTGSLFKVIGITIGALVVTVALGVGIGFGVLKLTEKRGSALDQSPVVMTSSEPTSSAVASPSVAPVASPSTTPASSFPAKSKAKILIVNATKVAGQAGKLKSTLAAAGYKTIDTGNAKGTYSTPGMFVLLAKDDAATESTLSTDSGTTLTFKDAKDTEDPKGAYDAVIVIGQ